jgi:hypothetical protein
MSTPGFTAQSALGGTTATYRAVANMLGDSGGTIMPSESSSLCCGTWWWTQTCKSINCNGKAICLCNANNDPVCYCLA